VIFYSSKDDGHNQFTNCQRGLLGTTAQTHGDGESIDLYSIKVSDNTEYPSPCLIQIDDEWIGPVQKGATTEYFTGVVSGAAPLDLNRGLYNQAVAHTAGALVIPVLRVRDLTCGRGDVVTIVENDQLTNQKELKTIRNATDRLFAFRDNITRNYNVDRITRILKFPSGELPSYLPGNLCVGGTEAGGAIPATIDEFRCFTSVGVSSAILNTYVISDTLSAGSHNDRIRIPNINGLGLSPFGGIVKLGNEVIGYGGIDGFSGEITGCVRGYLNSLPQTHDYRAKIFYIPYLPVVSLRNAIGPGDSAIPVTSMNGFSTDAAYLLVGNDFNQSEMIGYLWLDGVNTQFAMPFDRTGAGIFRGAFGTTPGSFMPGTLVYAMPFRYWHLEKSRAFHHEMAYFHTAHFAHDATWQRVRWTERHEPADDGMVQWRFLVRFDNNPHWANQPTNRKDGLFEFYSRNRSQDLNISANQIELLAFVQYQPGAFLTDSWKRAPALTNLYIDYTKPADIISHREE
ncbi:MAG: hypothetical protein V1701_12770, partial [Planctomycetota bacterium]